MWLLLISGPLRVESEAGVASRCGRLPCFRGWGRASSPAEMGTEDLKPRELLPACLRQLVTAHLSPMDLGHSPNSLTWCPKPSAHFMCPSQEGSWSQCTGPGESSSRLSKCTVPRADILPGFKQYVDKDHHFHASPLTELHTLYAWPGSPVPTPAEELNEWRKEGHDLRPNPSGKCFGHMCQEPWHGPTLCLSNPTPGTVSKEVIQKQKGKNLQRHRCSLQCSSWC